MCLCVCLCNFALHTGRVAFGDLMKFFNARRTVYRTNLRQIDDVIYTTYSYVPQGPPSSAPDENNAPSIGGRLGGGGGRGLRRGGASVKWHSSGSDGETTTATAVETPNLEAAHTGASTFQQRRRQKRSRTIFSASLNLLRLA